MVLFKSENEVLVLRENFTGKIIVEQQGEKIEYTIVDGEIVRKEHENRRES